MALLFFFFLPMAAQEKVTVSGKVLDEAGVPVIGASVIEDGTQNGAITDLDGNYILEVSAGSSLTVSSIGYKDVNIVLLDDQTVYNITMAEDSQLLDEVVVVGYGTMKRSDLSGASVSVSEESLRGSVISSLDQSLQGRAAGVAAVTTSGAPGSSSSIRVRGQATINANAEPLYVIDGVIVQGGGNSGSDFGLGDALGNGKVSTISPLSTINPADIVSMEILKDASATAIYGAQGANGVVIITTKRGKAGEAKISYDGMFAVSQQNSFSPHFRQTLSEAPVYTLSIEQTPVLYSFSETASTVFSRSSRVPALKRSRAAVLPASANATGCPRRIAGTFWRSLSGRIRKIPHPTSKSSIQSSDAEETPVTIDAANAAPAKNMVCRIRPSPANNPAQ